MRNYRTKPAMICGETELQENKQHSFEMDAKGTSNQKRILFLASQTDNRANGGMESATRIFEALSDHFSWTLITTRDSAFTERWKEGGTKVIVVPFDTYSPKIKRLAQWIHWCFRVVWTILRYRPDCVHANDIRVCRIAILPARILRKPLLFTLRDTKPAHELYGKHWYRATKHCQRVITLSNELGTEAAKRIGIPDSKITAINSIVDIDKFVPAGDEDRRATRKSLGISDKEFAIGVVGVIREKKGQLALIEKALPEILDRLPYAKVYLVGDFDPETDSYSAKCWRAVERLKLVDRIAFCGHTTEIADWYKALDVVLVPSLYEGLARCMIEAMACGVPVVSFDVCSAQEMLEQTAAGIAVEQGNYAGLAYAVTRVASDPEARELMGSRGREVAEQSFSEEKISDAFKQLYLDVIGSADGKVARKDQ